MQYALPAMYALFVWWFTTGIALYIVGKPAWRCWSMLGAVVLFLVSLYGLSAVSRDASVSGLYLSFTLAILVWGAIEISFLTGTVTGPMRRACPPGSDRVLRAIYATGAILWHELLLIAAGVAIVVASWGEPNQAGTWTFALLWVMRLSAKLNLFFGVPVTNEHLLPAPVAHLKSYFTQAPVGLFFAISVTLITIATVLFAQMSITGRWLRIEESVLLATLTALAAIEHWFMVLPLPVERLWGWSLRGGEGRSTPATVVTLAQAPDGARTHKTFDAKNVPVIDIREPAAPQARDAAPRDNVYPHPRLAKNGRRP